MGNYLEKYQNYKSKLQSEDICKTKNFIHQNFDERRQYTSNIDNFGNITYFSLKLTNAMELFRFLSLKSELKRKKIARIYQEVSSGMSNNSLSFDIIKKKIDEAGLLIKEIEKTNYKSIY